MPTVPPNPRDVSKSGGQNGGDEKLDAVHGQELVAGEEVLVCGAQNTLLSSDGGRIKLYCTLKGHHKVHYDEIFSKEWV
jgi:hypothetical protein